MKITKPYEVHNPLTGDWLLVSPQRTLRPWQGQREETTEKVMPQYDPTCYLCPGNKRSNGAHNPTYDKTFYFVNDFSALVQYYDMHAQDNDLPLFESRPETGRCEVICYSPRHDLTMAHMTEQEITQVIQLWQNRYSELGSDPAINHVQIFENRGPEMGASNPHPHGQIWAQSHVPTVPTKELFTQQAYYEGHGTAMLLDYAHREIEKAERVVYRNQHFVIVVPFWAIWPYETLLLPLQELPSLAQLSTTGTVSLSSALGALTRAYAELFNRSRYGSPYTMGIHQLPTDGRAGIGTQLHIHFEPPFLTSEKQKFLVGYERFGQPQRDLTTEGAANALRNSIAKQDSIND